MGNSTEAFDFVAANLDLEPALVVPEANANPVVEASADSLVVQSLHQEAPASTADFCL